jgi:phosphoserine phosphatase
LTSKIKVVAFDLDGVLFDGPSATFYVAGRLGIEQRLTDILQQVRSKQLPLRDSIIEGSKVWKGVRADGELDPLVEQMPLMKGAEETLSILKGHGYQVGCISSGVSQFFMKPFKKRLELDFAQSNILGETDGKHDGEVHYVMGGPEKAQTALDYLDAHGFSSENLASIGDGENDIELFGVSSLSIAFNPESERVGRAANLTIRSKDLRSVLPHFVSDL